MDSLRDCPNLMMAEERVLFYAAEIALALSHIHSMGMIYRDLKPANVLLCSNGHIQLTDMGGIVDSKGKVLGYAGADESGLFEEHQDAPNPTTDSNPNPLIDIKGAMPTMQVIDLEMSRGKSSGGSDVLDVPRSGFDSRSYGYGHSPKRANSISVSRYSDSALARATSLCGTSGYMAPEMFAQHLRKDAGYTNAIDYWSLGVLMYRLLVGTVPFPGNHVETFVADVAAQPRFNSEGQRYYPASYLAMYQKFRSVPGISETTIDLVTSFLEIIDMDRLGYGLKGLHKIKRHVGFKNIKWNLLIQKLVEPPFIPTSFHEEYIGSIQPFDSFEAMMRDQNRVGWLCMPVTATEQSYFQSW